MLFYDLVTTGKLKEDEIANIGDIINGDTKGRTSEDQVIVYAVGGMPTEDVGWGCKCLEKAKNRRWPEGSTFGQHLNLHKRGSIKSTTGGRQHEANCGTSDSGYDRKRA